MEGDVGSSSEMQADPVSLKVEADMLFQDADISGALRLWREALSLAEAKVGATNDNLQHTLRMNLVRGYTRRTEWSSVLEWCNAAIAVGSKDSKAYHWRAIALGRLSKWDEAQVALEDFLSVGGDANLAGRTRKEWERARGRETADSKDGPTSAPDGLRQRSVAQAQSTSNSSDSRKLMGGSGKSLTAGYIGPGANDKSKPSGGWLDKNGLLYAICPLHWNRRTFKLVLIVCVVSWFGGLGFGWCIRRELLAVGAL